MLVFDSVPFSARRVAGLALLALVTGGIAASGPALKGPRPKGSLMIVGGGERSDVMMRRFVELAGGPGRARIAVVPMASEEAVESGAETQGGARQPGRARVRLPGGPHPGRVAGVRAAARLGDRHLVLRRRPGAPHRGHRRHRVDPRDPGAVPGRRGRGRHLGGRRHHVRFDDHRRPDPAGRHHRLLRRRVSRHRAPPHRGASPASAFSTAPSSTSTSSSGSATTGS